MSKQQRTLHSFATLLVNYGNVDAKQKLDRDTLKTMAADLSDTEKMRVDEEVVTYYAAKCGVSVHERSKASEKGYGSLCPDFDREGTSIKNPAQKAAQTAIDKARGILFNRAKTTQAPTTVFGKMMGSVAYRAKKADEKGEKLSAQERRDARALMSALAALIG